MGEPERKHEHTIILIFASILIAALIWLVCSTFLGKNSTTLKLGSAVFTARIATTEAERAKGLSGTRYLAPNQAMLFVFPEPGYWGMWMRDMRYPIDILWISKDNEIVHMEQMVQPSSYPAVFESKQPALYVVELPAASIKTYRIKIGQKVDIEI